MSREQAEYVASDLARTFGTDWRVVPCGDHFHVFELAEEAFVEGGNPRSDEF